MPVAGCPRNPFGETSDRFHRRPLLLLSHRQDVIKNPHVEPGTIRRFVRGKITYQGSTGSSDFNWTRNDFDEIPSGEPLAVSTSLRYLISTLNTLTGGNQRSAPMERRPITRQKQSPAVALVYAGNVQGRPTVRSRITSFGSRVPALNRGN